MSGHTEKKDWHGEHIQFPKYVGCYDDADDNTRDLPFYIGSNLKIKTCFDRARSYGYAYVGL